MFKLSYTPIVFVPEAPSCEGGLSITPGSLSPSFVKYLTTFHPSEHVLVSSSPHFFSLFLYNIHINQLCTSCIHTISPYYDTLSGYNTSLTIFHQVKVCSYHQAFMFLTISPQYTHQLIILLASIHCLLITTLCGATTPHYFSPSEGVLVSSSTHVSHHFSTIYT